MELEKIQQLLTDLRKKWESNPEKRVIYKLQARPLQSALKMYYRDHPQTILPLDRKGETVIS